jgi:hypothetical protein
MRILDVHAITDLATEEDWNDIYENILGRLQAFPTDLKKTTML